MKQKITLLSFIFFLTLCSFGQRKELKDNRFDERSRIESHLKKLNRGENKYDKGSLFNKKRGVLQNSRANSSQSISSPLVVKYGLDSETSQSWDETSSQLVNDDKIEYTYDTKGNLTEYIHSNWDGSLWNIGWKIEYVYDAYGNPIEEIEYYLWEGQWNPDFKNEYTFDANGNPTQITYYTWSNSQWVMSDKTKYEYTYDTNENLIQNIEYYWDEGQWMNESKVEYSYDSNRNLTQFISYFWSGNQWALSYKAEYAYDSNGNLILYFDYWWDLSQWGYLSKTEYTYDINQNLTQYIDYWWGNFQWVNDWKAVFTYNNSYSFSDLILPYFYRNSEIRIFFNHMLTNGIGYNWDSDLNDWTITDSYTFSYSEQDILSVSKIIEEQLKLYPNPVSNTLTIKSGVNPIDKVEIYSVLGKKIKEINFDFDKIYVEDLSKGIYLLMIYTEKGTTIKKLIKK